jgi:AAA domain
MNTAGTLRLDRLKLTNFRCFTECEIDLHPKLTVLVAENGRGKTALLDAIGIALALFVDTLAGLGQSHGFERSDVHRARGADGKTAPKLPVKLAARGTFEGETLRWSRERSSTEKGKRTTTGSARELRKVALGLRARLAAFAGRLVRGAGAAGGGVLRDGAALERAPADEHQEGPSTIDDGARDRVLRLPVVVVVPDVRGLVRGHRGRGEEPGRARLRAGRAAGAAQQSPMGMSQFAGPHVVGYSLPSTHVRASPQTRVGSHIGSSHGPMGMSQFAGPHVVG